MGCVIKIIKLPPDIWSDRRRFRSEEDHPAPLCLFFVSGYANGADSSPDGASVIVDQSEVRVIYLAWTRLLLKLFVDFILHTQAACTQWMTETLEATVGVHRQLAL